MFILYLRFFLFFFFLLSYFLSVYFYASTQKKEMHYIFGEFIKRRDE